MVPTLRCKLLDGLDARRQLVTSLGDFCLDFVHVRSAFVLVQLERRRTELVRYDVINIVPYFDEVVDGRDFDGRVDVQKPLSQCIGFEFSYIRFK